MQNLEISLSFIRIIHESNILSLRLSSAALLFASAIRSAPLSIEEKAMYGISSLKFFRK